METSEHGRVSGEFMVLALVGFVINAGQALALVVVIRQNRNLERRFDAWIAPTDAHRFSEQLDNLRGKVLVIEAEIAGYKRVLYEIVEKTARELQLPIVTLRADVAQLKKKVAEFQADKKNAKEDSHA